MREGNPFTSKETLVVNECKPRASGGRTFRAIEIMKHWEDYRLKPQPEKLDALIDNVPNPDRVRLVSISYNSALTELPHFDRFRNLEYVHIAGRKIKSYEALWNLRKVKHLFLVNYKDPDLSDFSHLNLEHFRAIRGRLSIFELRATTVFLQDCSKLRRFGSSRIRNLTLEACNRVDLESLACVKGLRDLELLAQKNIRSFDFTHRCPDLCDITVTANRLKRADLSALYSNRRLRRLWLSVSNDVIIELARSNKGLVLSNGKICYKHGRMQNDTTAYYSH